MHCPYCGHIDSKVIDSRTVNDSVRRRRRCIECDRRFTTYERIEPYGLVVVKKDGRREAFSRNKLLTGLHKAFSKRPMSVQTIEKLVEEIEADVQGLGKAEIPSSTIGELVMERLRPLDEIAYIRFASVYREFKDIETLKQEVEKLDSLREDPTPRNQPSLIPPQELEALQRSQEAPAPVPPGRARPGRKPRQEAQARVS